MIRERLPNYRRRCVTREVHIGGHQAFVSIGMYADGRPGEVFVDLAKTGTALRAWAGATAKLVSLMLQYRVPLAEVVEALEDMNSEPWGSVLVQGCPGIDRCVGPIDFIAKLLELEFPAQRNGHEPGEWAVFADLFDRLLGDGELGLDGLREKLAERGCEEALDALLEGGG